MTPVELCDVAPRDGLQNERRTLAPSQRAELIDRIVHTGVPLVEATSFVSDARVPAMAGAEDVVAALAPDQVERCAGLVVNERGYARLAASGLRRVNVVVVATETFSQRNQGVSIADAVGTAGRIAAQAHADGIDPTVTIGAAFGCPFEGEVDPGHVHALAAEVVDGGATAITFADTIGVGVPRQARRLVGDAVALGVPVGVHLHNTRNTGYLNAHAALEAGATRLEAAVGGIGGCPFAPRATGNIATEDLVYLLEREGIDTGVDLDAIIRVAEWLGGQLGRELPGQVARAGTFPGPATEARRQPSPAVEARA